MAITYNDDSLSSTSLSHILKLLTALITKKISYLKATRSPLVRRLNYGDKASLFLCSISYNAAIVILVSKVTDAKDELRFTNEA